MLLVVNLLAGCVLLAVDLPLLRCGQRATVGGAFVVDLLGHPRLIRIRAGRFTRGHLSAAQSVGSALLLVGFAVVHLVRSDRGPVVLLVVDLLAGRILLLVDLLLLLVGELAAVRHAIVMHLLIDLGLGALRAGGLTRGHLSAAQAVGDALVLIRFALVGVVLTSRTTVGGRDGLRLHMLLRDLMIRHDV